MTLVWLPIIRLSHANYSFPNKSNLLANKVNCFSLRIINGNSSKKVHMKLCANSALLPLPFSDLHKGTFHI